AVVARAGDPGLPTRAAAYPPRDERSLLTFLVAAQPTAGAAVDATLRHWPAVTDAYRWSLERTRTTFSLVADPAGPLHRAGWPPPLEFEVTDCVRSGLRLAGPAAQPSRVVFTPLRPRSLDARAVMGIEPEFSGPRVEITYPRAVWDLPLSGNKP